MTYKFRWRNNIFHRLLCWVGVTESPSFKVRLKRRPTFLEALTGVGYVIPYTRRGTTKIIYLTDRREK